MSFSDQIGSFRRGNPAPLYLQLQHLLRDAIQRNVLSQDDTIPAERDLATEYDISRITVRKAIGGLVDEGLLTRRRGAGTFVAAGREELFQVNLIFRRDAPTWTSAEQ